MKHLQKFEGYDNDVDFLNDQEKDIVQDEIVQDDIDLEEMKDIVGLDDDLSADSMSKMDSWYNSLEDETPSEKTSKDYSYDKYDRKNIKNDSDILARLKGEM
jgi:hypothetical protein